MVAKWRKGRIDEGERWGGLLKLGRVHLNHALQHRRPTAAHNFWKDRLDIEVGIVWQCGHNQPDVVILLNGRNGLEERLE